MTEGEPNPGEMVFIDGHLDLAYNALAVGRDLTLPLAELRGLEQRTREEALITLPELRAGHLSIVFATLFVRPEAESATKDDLSGHSYRTPEEARALAAEQLELYERWEERGLVRILRDRQSLKAHLSAQDGVLGIVLLMEGADPISSPAEVTWWARRGVRIVGLSWQQTRYAGGTHAPGPLTELGRELIIALNETGLILDVSHLAEESFWQALELNPRALIASHSNARALLPTDRHLSDDMIHALAERDAVIGLVLGNRFIKAGLATGAPKESVTLKDLAEQATHIAELAGWQHLGIGSDFDGGFGVQETPLEIRRGADFARLGEAIPAAHRAAVLGGNWLRCLLHALPE
jgi:membrane dipeptidase